MKDTKIFTVDLYFEKSGVPVFGWKCEAFNSIHAKGLARQAAIAKGFKDEVKRIEVEVKS